MSHQGRHAAATAAAPEQTYGEPWPPYGPQSPAPKHSTTSHWTFRSFMAAVFWAFLTFAGFSLAYMAPADTGQQWGGSGLAVVAFAFLVCKIAGVRVRDVAGAVRRAWRW
jgi:hypothetical protein